MVEVKCSVYFLQTLPCFGGVVEVEVYPINLFGEGVIEVG